MDVKIYPSKPSGDIKIPSSKSMGHRAIICASLSNGISRISNLDFSDDIDTTILGMEKLGAKIKKEKNNLIIEGIKDFEKINDNIINCNESGSTLRFFIPIFSMLNQEIKFLGKNRLLKRPQEIYNEIFKKQNLEYIHSDDFIQINGRLKPQKYIIQGNISSQFITGLLFILPLLDGDSEIEIIPPFESKSYVDLTLEVISKFGINIKFQDELHIKIKGNQKYTPTDYKVEGDYSQLAFFAVLGAINSDVNCMGVAKDSLQGDREIVDILDSCNVKIDYLKNGVKFCKTDLSSSYEKNINLENCPDLGPILMVLGAKIGNFKIFNASRLRYKESDRILAMETELRKVGTNIYSDENNIYIEKINSSNLQDLKSQTPYRFYSHLDHRIAMSMAILATTLDKPSIITNSQCISKSYPDFFKDLKSLGIKLEIIK